MNACGDIISLNGTSSFDKTTIAREMQRLSDKHYWHTGIDHFLERMPIEVFKDAQWCELSFGESGHLRSVALGDTGRRTFIGMYRAIADMARAGIDVIIDDVLYDDGVFHAALTYLAPLSPLFVGLHCPLEVARERELRRGDRAIGGAEVFFERIHRHGIYDFELDTSLFTPHEAASAILEARPNQRTAFHRAGEAVRAASVYESRSAG